MVELLLALIAAHYLADLPLQQEKHGANKGKVFFEAVGFHCLTAHAMIHAGAAGAVAALFGHGFLLPFLVVGVSHWAFDFCKSWHGFNTWHLTNGAREGPQEYGLWGINVDQSLHIGVLAAVAVACTIV